VRVGWGVWVDRVGTVQIFWRAAKKKQGNSKITNLTKPRPISNNNLQGDVTAET